MIPTRIALNRPLPPLTYLAPEGLPPGVRVRVKVRASSAVGLVLGPDPAPPAAKLKPVEDILDPFPMLPPKLRELAAFASRYYGATAAQLLPLSLPQALRPRFEAALPDGRTLARIREAGAWNELAALGEAWHAGGLDLPTLMHREELRGAGLVEVRATGAPHPPRVTEPQARVLLALEEAGGALLEQELLRAARVTGAVLGTLERHGLIERLKRIDPLSQRREAGADRQVILNAEQRSAAEAVAMDAFQPHLLYGVTGSGKTEVYLELARRALDRGKRVLWLVPEIGLTPRLLARLEARFPGRVAVGHAGLNATEKQADVVRLLQNGADLFVGVRNAVMAPLRDIGLVIVDEEHEGSYKSEEHPRIQARDLAIKRAQLEGCPVVLGSATPSLESWHAAQTGRYKLLRLTERPAGAVMPVVEVVDLREAYKAVRKKVMFSPQLIEGIRGALSKGEQAMLLLNRRGYEAFWMCRACGQSLDCPHCSVSLTFHRAAHRLKCHLCGHEAAPPEACPFCGEAHLRGVGEGTERVEEELSRLFPAARILRLDRDTTARRGALEAALLAAEHGEVDILVGTQMLAKGHTFPKLTLVGILGADTGLKIPDFRAAERTFQLLTQVAGRAGRAERPGRVILQTYAPDHPAIRHAVNQDFEGFAAEELPYREALAYPPFAALALYRAEAEEAGDAREALAQIKSRLARVAGLRVLGPLEAPIARLKDRWRFQLLVKSERREALGEALRVAPPPSGGRVSLDRDPQQFTV
ncbi:MAG: primosomal protein N' [Acidobacteria bacterium]|nr:primosomal protein N' [Acidobacteriota bacterium]